jgi:hypothetical protein
LAKVRVGVFSTFVYRRVSKYSGDWDIQEAVAEEVELSRSIDI